MRNNKHLVFVLLVIFLGNACTKEENPLKDYSKVYDGNRVALLKVDGKQFIFEGGTELFFEEEASSFNVSGIYYSPGDFGGLEIFYDELDEPLFSGSVVWMGRGERNYPETLNEESYFQRLPQKIEMPEMSDFIDVSLKFAGVNETKTSDRKKIWRAIEKLEIVDGYRTLNPEAKIFIYYFRIGGDPEEGDWYVFLKN